MGQGSVKGYCSTRRSTERLHEYVYPIGVRPDITHGTWYPTLGEHGLGASPCMGFLYSQLPMTVIVSAESPGPSFDMATFAHDLHTSFSTLYIMSEGFTPHTTSRLYK